MKAKWKKSKQEKARWKKAQWGFVLGVLFFLGASPLKAELPTEKLGLSQALEYAFEHSPVWIGAQAETEAMSARAQGAGGWEAPRFMIEKGPQDERYSVVQPLPFWGWSDLESEAAELNAQAAALEQETKRRELERQVKSTFYDLWQLEEIPGLLEELQTLFEKLAETGSIESQRNQDMLGASLETQAKLGENAYELVQKQDQLTNARVRLNRLLGRSDDPWVLSVAEPPEPKIGMDLKALIAQALDTHPTLKALKLKEQAAARARELRSSKSHAPMVELGFNYFKMGPSSMGTNPVREYNYSFSLGFSLPWGNSRLGAEAKGEEATALAAKEQREAFEEEVIEQVSVHFHHAQNAYRLVRLMEDQVLPPAKMADRINQRLYSGGERGMSLSLGSRVNLLNIRIKTLNAKAEYLKAVAELEEWAGKVEKM